MELAANRHLMHEGPNEMTCCVPLFEDCRAEILHVHVPGRYNVCNFKCSYCYLPVYQARVAPAAIAALDRVVRRLRLVQRPLNVVFATDGEISATPELWPVLERVGQLPSLRLISLFSNCSGNWERILDSAAPGKISVVAACHLEQMMSKPGRLERFFRTVELLRRKVRSVMASFVLDPAQIGRFAWFKREMDERGIQTFAHPILQVQGRTRAYTEGELRVVAEILNETNSARMVNELMMEKTLPGLSCAAGRDYIQINLDGTVLACWKTKQVLGNLFADPPPRLHAGNSMCPFGGCACSWTAGFSEAVTRDYQRTNSLYNFVPRHGDEVSGANFLLQNG